MTTSERPLTLVTCGTGKTGRRVVDRLTALGVPTRVGSRSGEPPFDWSDRTTWEPALAGVDAVYLAYLPDIGDPQAPGDIAAFCELATTMGVRRAVLLSGRNEPTAQRCEDVVRSHRWASTVLRAAAFDQDFSEAFWLEPVRAGLVGLPAGDVAEPFVDADDIADVAVAALTGDGHAGEVYDLTGPESLPMSEAVAMIAAATGRAVRFEPMSAERYATTLVAEGVPPDEARFVADLFATLFDGRNAATADGVRRALGRPPRAFHDYVDSCARTGTWVSGA